MPITVTLARHIVRAAKKDEALLGAFASELAQSVDRKALADYLLDDATAQSLLARRLAEHPDKTLNDLERLGRNGARGRAAAPRRAAATSAAPKAAAPKAPGRGKGRRHRLSATQVEQYKRAIIDLLAKNPGANRKAITDAVGLPTPSIYNRLINELKAAGIVRSQGEKAKTVYTLTSGAARATRKSAAAPARKKKTGRKKKSAKSAKAGS